MLSNQDPDPIPGVWRNHKCHCGVEAYSATTLTALGNPFYLAPFSSSSFFSFFFPPSTKLNCNWFQKIAFIHFLYRRSLLFVVLVCLLTKPEGSLFYGAVGFSVLLCPFFIFCGNLFSTTGSPPILFAVLSS